MVPADHLPVVYYIDEHYCFLQNIQEKWLIYLHTCICQQSSCWWFCHESWASIWTPRKKIGIINPRNCLCYQFLHLSYRYFYIKERMPYNGSLTHSGTTHYNTTIPRYFWDHHFSFNSISAASLPVIKNLYHQQIRKANKILALDINHLYTSKTREARVWILVVLRIWLYL